MRNDEITNEDILENIRGGSSSSESIEEQKEFLKKLREKMLEEKHELSDDELEKVKAGRPL